MHIRRIADYLQPGWLARTYCTNLTHIQWQHDADADDDSSVAAAASEVCCFFSVRCVS